MTEPLSDLLGVLNQRGFINQTTDLSELNHRSRQPMSAYIGFDLTARSLHVGSLIQIMVLRWLAKLGHNPVVLFGEATTRIGDPTGKTTARPILTTEAIEENREGIAKVFDRLVPEAETVSNADWLNNDTSLFEYLTEFGTLFTINRMVAFDTVKSRLQAQQPMSFLEFNYMLFQAIDFLKLFTERGVSLQIGGSDQWGNIINGVEVVRRKTGETVFGLTTPLMTNNAGEKMGKTANGAVWLDPQLTSAFDFWQFWRNVDDAKVGEFLGLFTEMPMDEVERLSRLKGSEVNAAKKILATEVTRLVHGHAAAMKAERDAQSVFAGGGRGDNLPSVTVDASGGARSPAELFIAAGLVSSKGEADRLAKQGGMRIDGRPVEDARLPLSLRSGDELQLAAGKKRLALVRLV